MRLSRVGFDLRRNAASRGDRDPNVRTIVKPFEALYHAIPASRARCASRSSGLPARSALRHLLSGPPRLRQTDGNGLLAALHFFSGSAAAQRARFAFMQRLADLSAARSTVFPRHSSSAMTLPIICFALRPLLSALLRSCCGISVNRECDLAARVLARTRCFDASRSSG
jgi:hypothetical protein